MKKELYIKPLAQYSWFVPLIFVVVRLMMVITFPLEGLYGFGDIKHFYNVAQLGWPFLDYWVEYPPIFPFLSSLIYQLAGIREHIFVYLLVIILSLVQAGSIYIFIKLCELAHPGIAAEWRIFLYTILSIGLAYGWWYFDPLAVLFTLLGIYYIITGGDTLAGFALGAGILVKFFPLFVIPAVWRFRSIKRALKISSIAIGLTVLVYGMLYVIAPANTVASLGSQLNKGSWETIWALIDGNFNTGIFGPLSERLNPALAFGPQGNPARISPAITLILFLLVGVWIFFHARLDGPVPMIAFVGLTWCIFLLWSPGWSPQWVLYLIPLILLTLDDRNAILMTIILVLVNLLEWPVLLSRGYQWGLMLTIPLRTLILILLAWLWYQQITGRRTFPTRQIYQPGSVEQRG
jgi:hypothetical protein